eukprot:Hpha_TRINITY_DN35403_c0_g1::TRINITY_DN35403_c0_g1_i1::g.83432::m.83432
MTSEDGGEELADIREKVHRLYREHKPGASPKAIDIILRKCEGKEADLLSKLRRRWGVKGDDDSDTSRHDSRASTPSGWSEISCPQGPDAPADTSPLDSVTTPEAEPPAMQDAAPEFPRQETLPLGGAWSPVRSPGSPPVRSPGSPAKSLGGVGMSPLAKSGGEEETPAENPAPVASAPAPVACAARSRRVGAAFPADVDHRGSDFSPAAGPGDVRTAGVPNGEAGAHLPPAVRHLPPAESPQKPGSSPCEGSPHRSSCGAELSDCHEEPDMGNSPPPPREAPSPPTG